MSILVALPEPAVLSPAERACGHLAVVLARLLLAATGNRHDRLARVLRTASRHASPATAASAERARAVVETVSLRCASPQGCLPRSLAILVLCRVRGQRVTWRIGTHSPPAAAHAWIEAGGHPVGEPFDPRLVYAVIITT